MNTSIFRRIEEIAFVLLMALCCLGALIWSWCFCFIASGGKAWRGRYPVSPLLYLALVLLCGCVNSGWPWVRGSEKERAERVQRDLESLQERSRQEDAEVEESVDTIHRLRNQKWGEPIPNASRK